MVSADGRARIDGEYEAERVGTVWEGIDPDAPPSVAWLRPVATPRAVFLLGAFDPPTRAHLALVRGAARVSGGEPVLCFTKVLLDRPAGGLLPVDQRLELLDALAGAEGIGLAVANRGTYLEVARAAKATGVDPSFVIGSDKLPQLEDPDFYPNGERGVDETFAQARFLVVPRGVPVQRDDLIVLDPERVFEDPRLARLSATEVRKRLAEGLPVDEFVPPLVSRFLAGYTGSIEAR